jgi:hypothetical protein
MHTVTAWKCDHTNAIFERQKDAAKSEFRSLMAQVGGKLPAMGSISPADIMRWLAGNLEGQVYPTAFDALKDAVDYFEAHRDLLR